MNIYRYEENPLITPLDVVPYHEGYEVIGAFNGGVAKYGDETLLLLRVAEKPIAAHENEVVAPYFNVQEQKLERVSFDKNDPTYNFEDPRMIRHKDNLGGFIYLTSISYIRIARSKDGHNFTLDKEPFLYPFNEYQTFGIEDARVMQMEDTYYITFSAVSECGVADALVTTKDFKTYDYKGNIFAPENKDVLLFPEKISGSYYALHRPSAKNIGELDIWLASSPDLVNWGNHKRLIGVRQNSYDDGRVGGGCTPIKTKEGWLILYHGATKGHRYVMGAALLDLNDPSIVLKRTTEPFLEPVAEYEKNGFFGDVVFACGTIQEGDLLKMYYGVADTSMAGCEMKISDLLAHLERTSCLAK